MDPASALLRAPGVRPGLAAAAAGTAATARTSGVLNLTLGVGWGAKDRRAGRLAGPAAPAPPWLPAAALLDAAAEAGAGGPLSEPQLGRAARAVAGAGVAAAAAAQGPTARRAIDDASMSWKPSGLAALRAAGACGAGVPAGHSFYHNTRSSQHHTGMQA